MRRSTILIRLSGIILVLALLICIPGRKWARVHVNEKTATTDHPLSCTSCHLYIEKTGLVAKLVNARYLSPVNLTVSGDGKRLYVVAQESNALLIVDSKKNQLISTIGVGIQPHSVILSKDGLKAYVSNQWSDNVSVIDLSAGKVTDTLKTGNGPAGLALSSDGKALYVVNSFSSDVSVINLLSKEEINRITAGNNPTGAKLTPDGRFLFVTSRRAVIATYGEPLVSELTVINDSSKRISEYKKIESAYMMENVAFTPHGDLGFVTLIRPKNYVPSIQVEQGWMMTHGFGVIEPGKDGKISELLIDEPDSFYSDPFGIAITPDGKKAFISSAGADYISVIDIDSVRTLLAGVSPEVRKFYSNNLGISSHYILKRIHTGANPKGIALSPDGKLLYVAEMLDDKIGVINTESLQKVSTIDLGGPRRITVARRGRKLFNNSSHTFQNQYCCYTCHPDMHEDGLVYNMSGKDMGRNVTNTMTLRDISETAPFKWSGTNLTVYKQDGMRFSTFLTRTESFSYKDLDALTAYILTGIKNPPNLQYNPEGKLTEAQLRGKKIFERTEDNFGKEIPEGNRCITCHTPPYYTNRKMAYVQTLASTDDSILFDTPHLNDVYASAPYLHDGRAATLEEIWTKYGKNDKHGVVNDMTKIQLNDLIDYLKSLRSPNYEFEDLKKNHVKN
ncbi:MAG: beta-propeller fold lactonase family protein [Bacteroidales bacterium]